MIYFLLFISFALILFGINRDCEVHKEIGNLQNQINELKYKLLLPQIEEYKNLIGATHISQDNCDVELWKSKPRFATVAKFPFSQIDNELAKVKAILEISCPKKCAPKAKRK